ncbi:aspartic proteinase nepenthesin-1 [Ziziphus jujuba]|uniref:Aspartic proteinase nepenthesin-1 n=1 Tax=Ziziphus jujuba TaxID=326968 RepID=A0A6P4AKB1_ZIZJJ|nr:aspartic proteinase nepenthesin-1 [Ziziphus jujuba]
MAGFSLSLIPADSPRSPLYFGNLTKHERMQRLINITQARLRYIRHKTSSSSSSRNATSTKPDTIRCPMIRDIFYFAAHVNIGSNNWGLNLLLDTGGGLIWTQCEPCTPPNCFTISYGNFDPRNSTTYSKLPCSHAFCRGGLYDCVNNECVYNIDYGSGIGGGEGGFETIRGSTKGVASLERFTFDSTEGGPIYFDGIVFGCSNDSENVEWGDSHDIAGILGLSFSPDSLLSQLDDRIGRKFSYCIPSMDEEIQNDVILNFGNDIPTTTRRLQSTQFITPQGSHYFYLNLLDISVGSKRLGFRPGLFNPNDEQGEGFFIDSGAPVTVLDDDAYGVDVYKEVIDAFEQHYNYHGLVKSSIAPLGFELCYEHTHDIQDLLLTMTFHFYPRAEYVVHSLDGHYFDDLNGVFCVAILRGGRSMLGAYHQQNKRIIYNGAFLQFATEDCPN